MGTVPIQRTWTTGEIATAAELNSNVRDSINFLLATPRAVVSKNTTTSVVSSSTPALITWNTSSVDTDSMWSGPSSRIYAKTPGRFEFWLSVHYPFVASQAQSTYVFCGIRVNANATWGNGTELVQSVRCPSLASGFGTTVYCSMEWTMNAGDYAEFWTTQTMGSSQTVSSGSFNIAATGQWVAAS